MVRSIVANTVLLVLLLLAFRPLHTQARRRLDRTSASVQQDKLPADHLELAGDEEEVGVEERRKLGSANLKATRRLADPTNPEDHKVRDLPGLPAGESSALSHYAGTLQVDPARDGNLFYWLVEKPTGAAEAPLVIWLNGGPGCSSMDGLFLELGPFRLSGSGQVAINPYSWHNAANMLFVDQPVGTGYAYTGRPDGYAKTDAAINTHFTEFLEKFFALHSRYATVDSASGVRKTRPVYFSGESHAGHYIPNMIQHLLQRNAAAARGQLVVDVQGAALGNPWVDPPSQYDASDFAHGLGLITKGQVNSLKEANEKCKALLKTGRLSQRLCFELLDSVIAATAAPGGHRLLMYDARKFVAHTSSFPPGHQEMEQYLNRPDVRAALHATGNGKNKFEECADPPYDALAHQDGLSAAPSLADILDKGVRVLIYSGQYDMVCHHLGTENMLLALPWSGRADWLRAETAVWAADKSPAGYVKAAKNLQSLLVLDSGHMVPMDQPARALDMLRKFLAGEAFGGQPSSLKVSAKAPPGENCAPPASFPPHQRRASEAVGDGLAPEQLPGGGSAFLSSAAAALVRMEGHETLLLSGSVSVMLLLFVALSCCMWQRRRAHK